MKAVDELGISPMPWRVYDGERGNDGYFASVRDGDGLAVHYSDDTYTSAPFLEANARLIAASPELYECLREAAIEFCVNMCYMRCGECGKSEDECFVMKWVNVLAKAGGEEVP